MNRITSGDKQDNGTSINKAGWIDNDKIISSVKNEIYCSAFMLFLKLKTNPGKKYYFLATIYCKCANSNYNPDNFVENLTVNKGTEGCCIKCGYSKHKLLKIIPLNEKHYEQSLIDFIKK
ncbi:hypothetical protein IBT50_15770 [Bacillus sp. S70]|uniref:hypothetical protein n=1 Tax=unclassified Bacillus (in: firmicutes) TaxID=185979 RepID=UPI00190CB344|nr:MULTISPECIES: hypothetical protein [unclassified Bacillus (in: firmicutes)]MBJ9983024.1 hypothetical protein [Bacillus sp. S29]MBK0102819.1 hypothetical protein [Bacillus sp. S70]MBK0108132.1 hypothetical protein [Bacillus sp. S73]MBK0137413.1 hypothetical protein [Bacillus sp. S72]MBK0150447.1 hypothetical protein [Bacillus sp. S74]